jgi:hypothetical protein
MIHRMFVYGSADVLDAGGALSLIGADAEIGIGTVVGETTIGTAVGTCPAIPLEAVGLGDGSGKVRLIHAQIDIEREDQRGEDEQQSDNLHLLFFIINYSIGLVERL